MIMSANLALIYHTGLHIYLFHRENLNISNVLHTNDRECHVLSSRPYRMSMFHIRDMFISYNLIIHLGRLVPISKLQAIYMH